MTELFAALTPDAEIMTRLHRRLEAAAAADRSLDIAYRTVDSPVGALLLAGTETGLLRVAFATEDQDAVIAMLAARVSPRILRAPTRLDPAARELDQYFAGRRRSFEVPVDLRLASGFRREVLTQLQRIGYARTASYASVAANTSSPRAVRAVGTACATNPVPIVVPCHRVVRSDGATGNYRGGPAAKQALLTLEAAVQRGSTPPAPAGG